MKKKILIVGSSGNLGEYLFKELKKTNHLLGIERKKNLNSFICKDLSNSNLNFETFDYTKNLKLMISGFWRPQ